MSAQIAAIYCRLSQEDRNKDHETDDSGSIQNQKSMLLQYAIDQGWEIYSIYSDDNYTGSDRKRPAFNRLLEDAKNKKFNIVLCKSQSRFTREIELVEKYINGLFPVWGIRFISLIDNADTDNRYNRKSRQINGLVNEWYLEEMSDNIRSVLTNRRKNGYHIGAFALYGYRKDPARKGHLVIDEEAAAVVREVFTLFSQGYGKTAIARILNDRGIPNPTEYKRLKGLRYQQPKGGNSTLWKYAAISGMLTNEIYIGNMVQGKYGSISYKTKQNKPRPREEWYVVKGTHEPIIDLDLWNRVQALIGERSKPFIVGEIGLFARKVRCAGCGSVMRSGKNRGKHYLKCANRHISKDSCEGAFIAVDKLEKTVLSELHRLSEAFLNKDELERSIEFTDSVEKQKQQLSDTLAAYRKKQGEYEKAIRDTYLDKSRGLISEEEYRAFSEEFSARRDQLRRIVSSTEQQINALDETIKAGDNRRAMIEQYTHTEHLTREMVEILIDYIVVGKRLPGMKTAPIEIHWNF